ncbi:MAG: Uma2 family endonuclease [Phycisphaerales bacterium]|nr:Uma2 family endonuclease [Phycisphaerales bacterium]
MSTRTMMTLEEFESVCERLGPCELVRGEVIELSPGGLEHSRITVNVAVVLSNWATETGLGRVLSGEAGIRVEADPPTVRGADAAYLSYQRWPKGRELIGFTTVVPELVVEILGKGQGWREMVEKCGEYLRMGVLRVWVIDPDTRRVHVFRPDAEPAAISETGQLCDEVVLPGFSCAVARLFED